MAMARRAVVTSGAGGAERGEVVTATSMREGSKGYSSDVTSHLSYLIAIGFAPVVAMLLLVIVTRLENSLSHENVRRRS